MSQHIAPPGIARAHVEARRARVLGHSGREPRPAPPGSPALPPERVAHLVREAEELYWNELAWEELTDEERVAGGHLTELVFPGFLAFVDGLLLDAAGDDPGSGARPRPEVIEEVLLFLAGRYTEATAELEQGADSERLVWSRSLTGHLIDLVLYRLYGLTAAEREAIEDRG